MVRDPISLYLHIPFCVHRCGYCDFNTYAGLESLIPSYVSALESEIRIFAENSGSHIPIHTIYFGGGTPSLLPADAVAGILDCIGKEFSVQTDAEITLEVNPGTVTEEYWLCIREAGINRISMGVQSSKIEELRLLERTHDYDDVITAVRDSRLAGFANVSVDLIFGLPFQTLAQWQANLDSALSLKPDHISLYALSVEHGTPMAKQVSRGLIAAPDGDLMAEMYEWTEERLGSEGFDHYEISNWAQSTERRSKHNIQYWQNRAYVGLGAGAHGYVAGYRTLNALNPGAYISRLGDASGRGKGKFPRTPATVRASKVTSDEEIAETMMMGLRLLDKGIVRQEFQERFGISLNDRFGKAISELADLGLLEDSPERIRLTQAGRLLGNQVFFRFV